MRKTIALALLVGALGTGGSAAVAAQESTLLPVGTMAPDFEMTGTTRYGVLAEPVHLSDFRGETVVLAFFFRARTRG